MTHTDDAVGGLVHRLTEDTTWQPRDLEQRYILLNAAHAWLIRAEHLELDLEAEYRRMRRMLGVVQVGDAGE